MYSSRLYVCVCIVCPFSSVRCSCPTINVCTFQWKFGNNEPRCLQAQHIACSTCDALDAASTQRSGCSIFACEESTSQPFICLLLHYSQSFVLFNKKKTQDHTFQTFQTFWENRWVYLYSYTSIVATKRWKIEIIMRIALIYYIKCIRKGSCPQIGISAPTISHCQFVHLFSFQKCTCRHKILLVDL